MEVSDGEALWLAVLIYISFKSKVLFIFKMIYDKNIFNNGLYVVSCYDGKS